MIIPVKLEISYTKYPIANIVMIVFMVVIEFLFLSMTLPPSDFERFILEDWNIKGLIGHMFIHANLTHLMGNMIFMWVFGNAICATIGNIAYPFLYIVLGLSAAATHLLFGGGAALGASGAINGIIGMALILYPKNKLKIFYAFFWIFAGIFKVGNFRVKSFWMILLWFVFDVLGAIAGLGNIAYTAHIGGFLAGIVIAYLLLLTNLVETYSPSYKDIVTEKETELAKKNPIKSSLLIDDYETGLKDTGHLKTNLQYEEMKLVEEARQVLSEQSDASPEFKVLRVVSSSEVITCFYVNKGDRISNISIEALGNFIIQIIPPEIIEKGDSGAIKFSNLRDHTDELKFRIGFSKPDSNRKFMEFALNKNDNTITEIKSTNPAGF